MDEPVTSMRNGSEAARSRSKRASASGFDDAPPEEFADEFVVSIAGLPLLIRVTDAAYVGVVHRVFGTIAVCRDEPQFQLVYGPGDLDLPTRPPDERHDDLDVWRDGNALTLDAEPHGVRALVTTTHARVVSNGFVPERGFRRIFQPLITHVLGYHGSYVVHAASMRKGDRGLLALGESGKGKSTMAAAALQHGWRVMGDDLVALRLVDGKPMIRGLPKPMALPNDVDPGAAAADAPRVEWDHRQRRHVSTDALDLDEVELGGLVLVEHGSDPRSTREVLPRDHATSFLMASFTSIGNSRLMRELFPVAARAAGVPCWRVLHGVDANARLADAGEILDAIAAEW